LQKPSEHAPATVQHGRGHPGFRQLQAAHIPDEDILITFNDGATELVTGILPATTNLPMQALGLPPMSAALQGSQPGQSIAVAAQSVHTVTIAGHDRSHCVSRGTFRAVIENEDLDLEVRVLQRARDGLAKEYRTPEGRDYH
jgi:hypothetical protein